MVNTTTDNSDGDAAKSSERDWGPWYLPWWKPPVALMWATASYIGSGYSVAGGAIGSVVSAILLTYLLTRVSRGLRE